MTKFRSVAEKN